MPNIWHTSISEVMCIAREAMRALVPAMEKAKIPWREPKSYDDWDLIASSVYKAVVILGTENSPEFEQASKIIDYDRRVEDYSSFSFITDLASDRLLAFVSFATDFEPFDACLFAELDENGRVETTLRRPFGAVDWGVAARHGTSLDKLRSLAVLL
jgi:hypothetical protein